MVIIWLSQAHAHLLFNRWVEWVANLAINPDFGWLPTVIFSPRTRRHWPLWQLVTTMCKVFFMPTVYSEVRVLQVQLCVCTVMCKWKRLCTIVIKYLHFRLFTPSFHCHNSTECHWWNGMAKYVLATSIVYNTEKAPQQKQLYNTYAEQQIVTQCLCYSQPQPECHSNISVFPVVTANYPSL